MVDDSATSSNLIENIQEEVEIKVVSPIDQSVIKNITLDTPDQALGKVEVAESAFKGTWRSTPLQDRIDLVLRFVDCLLAKKHEIVKELSWMMGR